MADPAREPQWYEPRPPLRYDLVTSTQDVARELVRLEGREVVGTVITARRMSAGRGRQGRTWHAPPGTNVCLTTILPPVALADLWQMAIVAGVAVAEGVQDIAPETSPRLRFPNDVYLDGRKLSGVLVETALVPRERGEKAFPLLGIGVNVEAAPLPEEIAARAISLEEATGVRYPVEKVSEAVLLRLRACAQSWYQGGLEAVLPRWRDYHDPHLKRMFVQEGEPTPCTVQELTSAGVVTLGLPNGGTVYLQVAQVILGDD